MPLSKVDIKSSKKSIGLIDIIVINYNSTNSLIKLLNSVNHIHDQKTIDHIFIIDNNSDDRCKITTTKYSFPIKIIRNKTNRGFAYAVNQGLHISTTKYVALINPDCIANKSTFSACLNTLENNPNIGIIGGLIHNLNHKIQLSSNSKPTFTTAVLEFTNFKRIFPNNSETKRFWNSEIYSYNSLVDVDAICGAYMIIRKKHPNKKISFDTNYFLYLEDLDFCITHKQNNYRVVFNPYGSIKHIGGTSSGNKYNIVLKHWYHSRKYYFIKHQGTIKGLILWVIFSCEEVILKLTHPFDKYA